MRYVLGNPYYIGRQRRSLEGRREEDRYRRGKEFAVVPGAHEAAVEEDLFWEVQEQLFREGNQELKKTEPYLLRGLVRCGSCGRILTRAAGGEALQCPGYGRKKCKKSHFVRMEDIEYAVWNQVKLDWGDQFPQWNKKSIEESNAVLLSWIGEILYFAEDRSIEIRYRR